MNPSGYFTRLAIFGYLVSSCTGSLLNGVFELLFLGLCKIAMHGKFRLLFVGTENVSITQTNEGRAYYPGELVFADEFDSFNLETWSHDHTLGGTV